MRNAFVFFDGAFIKKDVLLEDGIIADIKPFISPVSGVTVFDMNNCFVFPGLIDVHVHLREPGFSYKETILSGSKAAAHGGFTTVCAMPNLNPVPDSLQNLDLQLEIIENEAFVHVLPYASITVGEKQQELSDMDTLAWLALAFSDDGVGVQSGEMMEKAMFKAKALNKIIAAHCEVNELLNGGCIHDGEYARQNGYKGISSESEWREVERDIELIRKTHCDYHVCHISTKESVDLIRKAKAEGLPISCETAPHYLVFCDEDLQDDGRFRMNPPIRSSEDRKALLEGLIDGTIDMIATDHAPHSKEEKSRGLRNSLNGIVGLETSFPILYTKLVRSGLITLEKLIELMQGNPSKRFGIGSELKIGAPADLTVFDLNQEYVVDANDFLSQGRSTPFEGEAVFGKCLMTMVDGVPVWEDETFCEKHKHSGEG
ncbi:MAG: dihydroorotase [Oscillospiraceae bacterium]|nr:dihydroorotase [Oscillospiraceae bacterium]